MLMSSIHPSSLCHCVPWSAADIGPSSEHTVVYKSRHGPFPMVGFQPGVVSLQRCTLRNLLLVLMPLCDSLCESELALSLTRSQQNVNMVTRGFPERSDAVLHLPSSLQEATLQRQLPCTRSDLPKMVML
jgi:hypothetical protein